MFFGNRTEKEKLDEVKQFISTLTGEEVADGRAQRILSAFESFESFVESGQTFQDLRDSVSPIQTVGMFQEFVNQRGGALVGNEVWILFAFLNWCEHGFAVVAQEAKLLKILRDTVRAKSSGRRFEMDKETLQHLQNLIGFWIGDKREKERKG